MYYTCINLFKLITAAFIIEFYSKRKLINILLLFSHVEDLISSLKKILCQELINFIHFSLLVFT